MKFLTFMGIFYGLLFLVAVILVNVPLSFLVGLLGVILVVALTIKLESVEKSIENSPTLEEWAELRKRVKSLEKKAKELVRSIEQFNA